MRKRGVGKCECDAKKRGGRGKEREGEKCKKGNKLRLDYDVNRGERGRSERGKVEICD